jgi:hypothetical protein
MGFRNTLKNYSGTVVEELQRASGQPEARSVDDFTGGSTRYNRVARSGKADKHYPEKEDLERYWEIYKEVSIIRDPIRSFASEVVGPGYYIDTENEDLKEELEDWLQHSSIVGGEIDKDFSFLLKKAQIQREVKGTVFCEKVENQDDELYGFKLMKPETVRAFTKPGQTVLLPPDYDPDEQEENTNGLLQNLIEEQNFYTNGDDETAAYVQLDETISGNDDGYYIPFTRDQVLKLDRDSDIGSIFGESRIAAVEDRLNSLLKKLDDNDKAIESVSQPFQLFKFGTGDSGPWEPEEISSFMEEHSASEFEPGMKQGVQGDVEVDTVEGEVADIKEFLDWDLNWIISEMPMPLYSLGAFTSDVNQFISRSQSARLERQVQEARDEIQNEWTPVIEEKAEELGYSAEEVNGLVIGEDPSDLNLVQDAKGNVVPEDDVDEGNIPDANNSNSPNEGPAGENFGRPPASSESNRDGGGDTT